MPPDVCFPSSEALFRYCLISVVLAKMAEQSSRSAAVRLVAELSRELCGGQRAVSVRTLQRWLKAYLERDLPGLEPRMREPIAGSSTLPAPFLTMLEEEFSLPPEKRLSIPEVIDKARANGILGENERVDRTTVWRVVRRMGFDTTRAKRAPRDTRRFAYREPMQMLLADFTHFRAGPTQVRRVALFVLDDATRFVIKAVVSTEGSGEAAEPFLMAIYEVLQHYGRFDALFLDNGPAFIADMLALVMSRLGIALIHGTAGYPQGHGKIERFNRDVKAKLLHSLPGADIDPHPDALTVRLHEFVRYRNAQPHGGLDGATPYERWTQGRALRPIPEEELKRAFVFPLERKVSADHIVKVDGTAYEVPLGNAKRYVTLERHFLEDNALYFPTQSGAIKLEEVDLYANAKARRAPNEAEKAQSAGEESDVESPRSSTAAMERFNRNLSPLTDSDGGYVAPSSPTPNEEEPSCQ